MTAPLEFTTAPKTDDTTTGPEIPALPLRLDGVDLLAVKPKDALIAELGAVTSRRTPVLEKIRVALNFLDDCLLSPGKDHVRGRLLDPTDALDVADVMPMLTAIAEHWKASTAPAARRRQ